MDERPVLLIDEIDKADIEFPNDLLQELDRMEFYVYETHETIKAKHRPIVIITSNNEKELPDAFLRRCFFHYIKFPDPETMRSIVDVHFPNLKGRLVSEALKVFYDVRDVPGIKKKPSTSELLDWIKLLLNEDISPETLRESDPRKLIPPLHGALLKNEQDVHLFERLAFLAKRQGHSRAEQACCARVVAGLRPLTSGRVRYCRRPTTGSASWPDATQPARRHCFVGYTPTSRPAPRPGIHRFCKLFAVPLTDRLPATSMLVRSKTRSGESAMRACSSSALTTAGLMLASVASAEPFSPTAATSPGPLPASGVIEGGYPVGDKETSHSLDKTTSHTRRRVRIVVRSSLSPCRRLDSRLRSRRSLAGDRDWLQRSGRKVRQMQLRPTSDQQLSTPRRNRRA